MVLRVALGLLPAQFVDCARQKRRTRFGKSGLPQEFPKLSLGRQFAVRELKLDGFDPRVVVRGEGHKADLDQIQLCQRADAGFFRHSSTRGPNTQ